MNIIQQGEIRILRERATTAISSGIKSAEWYIDRALEAADQAEQSTDENQRAALTEKAQKNENTGRRLKKEAEDIGDYIKTLEAALVQAQEQVREAHDAGVSAGYKAAEKAAQGQFSARNSTGGGEYDRAVKWVVERIGPSTEGEWVNGIHISQIPNKQNIQYLQ